MISGSHHRDTRYFVFDLDGIIRSTGIERRNERHPDHAQRNAFQGGVGGTCTQHRYSVSPLSRTVLSGHGDSNFVVPRNERLVGLVSDNGSPIMIRRSCNRDACHRVGNVQSIIHGRRVESRTEGTGTHVNAFQGSIGRSRQFGDNPALLPQIRILVQCLRPVGNGEGNAVRVVEKRIEQNRRNGSVTGYGSYPAVAKSPPAYGRDRSRNFHRYQTGTMQESAELHGSHRVRNLDGRQRRTILQRQTRNSIVLNRRGTHVESLQSACHIRADICEISRLERSALDGQVSDGYGNTGIRHRPLQIDCGSNTNDILLCRRFESREGNKSQTQHCDKSVFRGYRRFSFVRASFDFT